MENVIKFFSEGDPEKEKLLRTAIIVEQISLLEEITRTLMDMAEQSRKSPFESMRARLGGYVTVLHLLESIADHLSEEYNFAVKKNNFPVDMGN